MTRGKGLVLPTALSLVPFALLATANSAGYRYGASDLAFYGPAVMRALDPALFPRDRVLIDAQAHLTFMDETVATIARLTTTNLPWLFLGLYLVTLALLAWGTSLVGARLYRSQWTIAALLAAVTLRHAIPKSGTNTLEGYFHPRQLAFAFGVLALAAFLRGRNALIVPALFGAALLHPTTTLWWTIWIGVAVAVSDVRRPAILAIGALVIAGGAAWALAAGPLAGRLGTMDPEWIGAIAEKDYLFPAEWPLSAWAINLAYLPAILLLYGRRRKAGLAGPREAGMVAGTAALAVVFLAAVPLNAYHVGLAVQLQPARIFWMLDFLTIVYAVWFLAEDAGAAAARPRLAAMALTAAALIRGVYVMRVEFPDRPLFETHVPGDWGRVAAWASATPTGTAWLADPSHAALYGTSFRMAAGRDVFVEAAKDTAVGMYDRQVALLAAARLEEVKDFYQLSAERARTLAAQHGLDYLVSETALPLPLAFESGRIRVYALR